MFKGKKVIIFDMDGTLIDSIGIWNAVDRHMLSGLGVSDMDDNAIQAQRDHLLRAFAGAENPYLAYCGAIGEKYGAGMPAEEVMRRRYAIAADYLESRINYKPGAPEFLRRLRAQGFRLAVATTSKKNNVDIYRTKNKNILSKAPLDAYFERIYTQADVREIKPNPEIYLKLMRDMGAAPAECLIFEDSLVGIEAANNAGVDVIAMYDSHSEADWPEILRRARAGFRSYNELMQAMDEANLMNQIRAYVPFNEQEARDQAEILRRLESGEALFERSNLSAHMTASAWVVSPDRKQALMAYHNIYDSWAWLGGHADGERDLLQVALREVCEESGLENLRPVSQGIFSLEILTVDGHEKKGKYVPSHLHLNLTYLIEADPAGHVRMKADENSGVRWFALNDAIAASSEPWFKERIYSKLNAKLRIMQA